MIAGTAMREWGPRRLVFGAAGCLLTIGCAQDAVLGEHVAIAGSAGASSGDFTSSTRTQDTFHSDSEAESTTKDSPDTDRDRTHFFDPHLDATRFFDGKDGGRPPRPPGPPDASVDHPEDLGPPFHFDPQTPPSDPSTSTGG